MPNRMDKNMGFAKLVDSIIHSSIWSEPLPTRVLWVTMLAMKDENGLVAASMSGLQRAANITPEEFDRAIASLESPDKDSRTPDHEGRRIEKIDGGWLVLNHELYRLEEGKKREQTRERVRRHRAKKQGLTEDVTQSNVTHALPSVSVSVSDSVSVEKEASDLPTIKEVVSFLNETLGTRYSHKTIDTKKLVRARLADGFELNDFKLVIRWKHHEWKGEEKTRAWLRPSTLFGNKFESYLNAARIEDTKRQENKIHGV